jgi:sulfoxide reductase heme-binding subunit YedZ
MDENPLAPPAVGATTKPSPWRGVLIVAYVILSLIPLAIFFRVRGGLMAIPATDLRSLTYFLFPLLGLYAFTVLWLQLLVGSSMAPLTRLFPNIRQIHKRHGIYALVFSVLHPLFLLIGVGLSDFVTFQYIAPEQLWFALLGYLQLILLATVVTTALLMRSRFLRGKRWRYVHFLTYFAFISVWIHSWFLGTDVQTTPLRYFWIFAGLTAIVSVSWRFKRSQSFLHT